MSLDATRWAWQQTIRPTHKLVLLSLADRAGENHECHPSISRLCSDTGLYRETIMEAVAQLEQLGLLRVARMVGAGNKYQLVGVVGRHETSRQNQSGKADMSAKPDQSGKADTTSLEKPTTTSREKPTLNLPMNLPRTESVAFAHVPGLNSEVWIRWEKYRSEIRKPIKPASILAAQKKLAGYGDDQSAVVEQSIANGWQGLFSLKDAAKKQEEKRDHWI